MLIFPLGVILIFATVFYLVEVFPNRDKFKKGDILVRDDKEAWEKDDVSFRVLEIGKKNYLLQQLCENSDPTMHGTTRTMSKDFANLTYTKKG